MATGGNKVVVTMEADDADLLRAWQKQNLEIIKNQRALAKMGGAGERAGRQTTSGLQRSTQEAARFVAAITGVGSLVGGIAVVARQLRAEFEAIVSRQKTAADRQVDFATAISQTVRNVGGLLSPAEVEKSVRDVSRATGVGQTKTAIALGAAFSARGAVTPEQARESIAATKAALKFAPELEAQGVAALAGVAIDIGKRNKVSPEKAIGFIQNVASLARVTDLPNVVQNIAPAINNLGNFGFTPQQAGAFVTTLTQGTGDFSGATSRTAALNFGASIKKAFPGELPIDVINKLRADPKAREKFLREGVFGKGVAKPTIENILTPGTIDAASFDAGPAKIGSFDDARITFDQTVRDINSIQAVRNARIRQTLQTGAETLSLQDITGGRTGITREGLEQVLRASGASDFAVKAARANFEFGGGLNGVAQVDRLARNFRSRSADLSALEEAINVPSTEFNDGRTVMVPRTPSEQDLRLADTLLNLAAAIERLADDPVKDRGKQSRPPAAAANSRSN